MLWQCDFSMPDTELRQILEKAKQLHKPKNYGNHYKGIKNAFDLILHGNVAVYQP
jgi:hypothetical protein